MTGVQTCALPICTEKGQTITFSVNGIGTDKIGTQQVTAVTEVVENGNITTPGVEGVTAAYVSGIDIKDAAGAQAGLQVITDAIEQVAGDRATYGALQNRLEYTVSNLMNVAEFTTAARSRIEDADFAAESARLAKAQVLQQTGTAMLAQANASSQLALSLIR